MASPFACTSSPPEIRSHFLDSGSCRASAFYSESLRPVCERSSVSAASNFYEGWVFIMITAQFVQLISVEFVWTMCLESLRWKRCILDHRRGLRKKVVRNSSFAGSCPVSSPGTTGAGLEKPFWTRKLTTSPGIPVVAVYWAYDTYTQT